MNFIINFIEASCSFKLALTSCWQKDNCKEVGHPNSKQYKWCCLCHTRLSTRVSQIAYTIVSCVEWWWSGYARYAVQLQRSFHWSETSAKLMQCHWQDSIANQHATGSSIKKSVSFGISPYKNEIRMQSAILFPNKLLLFNEFSPLRIWYLSNLHCTI